MGQQHLNILSFVSAKYWTESVILMGGHQSINPLATCDVKEACLWANWKTAGNTEKVDFFLKKGSGK